MSTIGPRVLVFSTVFPNPKRPMHGLFVKERARYLSYKVPLRVVAPVVRVPWSKGNAPVRSESDGMAVIHPTWLYVPRVFKFLDGMFLFLFTFPALLRFKKEFDFDLIDAHFAYPEGFAAILLGRFFRVPVTITLRGTLIPLSVHPWRRRMAYWALRRSARVIGVSTQLVEHARQAGISGDKLALIENGVDAGKFVPMDRVAARQALTVRSDTKLIVSVGHLSPRKGFQRLIEIFPTLSEEFPNAQLVIVGGAGAEGNNEGLLRRMIDDRQLNGHVVLAGPAPRELVARWLSASDLFVLASDYEGCPNVVLEAMACGRPVVSSDVGQVKEMVPDFAGIVYGDPYDLRALKESIVKALGANWNHGEIRKYAETKTWESVADRVLDQWRHALAAQP